MEILFWPDWFLTPFGCDLGPSGRHELNIAQLQNSRQQFEDITDLLLREFHDLQSFLQIEDNVDHPFMNTPAWIWTHKFTMTSAEASTCKHVNTFSCSLPYHHTIKENFVIQALVFHTSRLP